MRKWLADIRGERTQAEVAALCGISQNYYSYIETGEKRPAVDTAKKIASALGFDWTLFYEEGSIANLDKSMEGVKEQVNEQSTNL